MTGLANLEEVIAKLEAATEDAREVTRELHSTIKAARAAERDLGAQIERASVELPVVMEKALGELINEGLGQYAASLKQAMKNATDMVRDTFERQTNVCLYGNEQGRGVSIMDEISAHLQRARDNLNRDSPGGGLGRYSDQLPDLHRGPR